MAWTLQVKPSGLPPEDLYTQLWAYVLTDSEFSCLATLAKPYPVSGPTYVPLIPNQHNCMSKGAHEMLWTIFAARYMSGFSVKSIVLSICE